jgi:hypothetical protein
MSNVREIISMSILAGLGLAVILNAGNAAKVVSALSTAWIGVIQAVSGTTKA